MEFRDFLNLLGKKKGVFALFVVIFLAIAWAFILVTPLKYEANSRILIVQDFSEGASSYTITQSNDNLSRLLAQVVGSSSFLKDVINSGYNIESEYFSPTGDSQEMARKWKESVEAKALGNGEGIVDISVYHTDRAQLKQIAEAINYVLKTKHTEYHGLGRKIEIRIIDYPILSQYPVQPNVLYIFSLALVLGVITGGSYIYLFHAPSSRPQEPAADTFIPEQKHQEQPEPGQESFYSFDQEERPPSIPIKQEDEKEFLGEEQPPESNKEGTTAEVEEAEVSDPSFTEPSPQEKKDIRDIEEKGDMNNIWK